MDEVRGRHLHQSLDFIPRNNITDVCLQVEVLSVNLDLKTKVKPKLSMEYTVKAWGPHGETLEFEPLTHVRLVL